MLLLFLFQFIDTMVNINITSVCQVSVNFWIIVEIEPFWLWSTKKHFHFLTSKRKQIVEPA